MTGILLTAEESLKLASNAMIYGEIDIKRAVSESRRVYFRHYHNGYLWYVTKFDEAFPVPVTDIGTATFRLNEKAILLMRYMRKWNGDVESALHDVHEGIPDGVSSGVPGG